MRGCRLARIEAGLHAAGQDFVCCREFFGVRNLQGGATAVHDLAGAHYKVSAPRPAAAAANVAELRFAVQQNRLT
jgi:hypothetical protein